MLQYKKRCGDLEQSLQEKTSELDKHLLSVSETCSAFYSGIIIPLNLPQGVSDASNGRHQAEQSSNLEDALIRLEEEQQRSD